MKNGDKRKLIGIFFLEKNELIINKKYIKMKNKKDE